MDSVEGRVKSFFFELPTFQRRLRNLKGIAVRNLTLKQPFSGDDVLAMKTYFTLHHSDTGPAFYTSETLTGTLNPTWKSFNTQQFASADHFLTSVIVRVWTVLRTKDNACVSIEWTVDLSGLVFVGDQVKGEAMHFSTNTILFGMFDKMFTAPTNPVKTSLQRDQQFLKCDQSAVRWSYSTNTLARVNTIKRAIQQTQATEHRHKKCIENKILASQTTQNKLSQQEMSQLIVTQLKNELETRTMQLQALKEQCEKYQIRNHQKDVRIKQNMETLSNDEDRVDEKKRGYFTNREKYVKTNAQLIMRKKQIISDLALIFPVNECDGPNWYSICGVRLPNSEEFQGLEETMIAVSLGCTCHMVQMIAHFLDIPLRYTILQKSSKSKIQDHISDKIADKDRDFPLYSKGKDKNHFNYAVYLLNKNIAQLRFYCGLGTQDLRCTLPNLKSLLELRLGVKYEDKKMKQFDKISMTNSSGSPSPLPSLCVISVEHNDNSTGLSEQHNDPFGQQSASDRDIRLSFDAKEPANNINNVRDLDETFEVLCANECIANQAGVSSVPVLSNKHPFHQIVDGVSSGDETGSCGPSKQYESRFKTWQRTTDSNDRNSSVSEASEAEEDQTCQETETSIISSLFAK